MKPDYGATTKAFDAVASHYDARYGPQANALMAWMRRESLALLKATFPRESYLLEIGCGTGEEAIALAAEGRRVLATDIAPKMAALAREKAAAAGLGDRVAVVAAAASGIDALRPPESLDGAYASFGALNCEPDLQRLAAALARILKPGSAFVCSVMALVCPFEMAWFLLHGRPNQAVRRLQSEWQAAPIAGQHGVDALVATRYLTVGMLKEAFSPHFSVDRTLSLPILLPPPYLDALFRTRRRLFTVLERLEILVREQWPWRLWGDHVCVILRRRHVPGRT